MALGWLDCKSSRLTATSGTDAAGVSGLLTDVSGTTEGVSGLLIGVSGVLENGPPLSCEPAELESSRFTGVTTSSSYNSLQQCEGRKLI